MSSPSTSPLDRRSSNWAIDEKSEESSGSEVWTDDEKQPMYIDILHDYIPRSYPRRDFLYHSRRAWRAHRARSPSPSPEPRGLSEEAYSTLLDIVEYSLDHNQ
jgi:hypothetical protein